MLGYIATDAPIAKPLLDQWVKALADKSFNRVTVDGDTSTNDACMLISTAKAEMPEITELPPAQRKAVYATASFDMWHRLRSVQGMDRESAVSITVTLIKTLLKDN